MNKTTGPDDISSTIEAGWSVNQLADESGLSIRTIRYYQSKGLLPPPALHGKSAVYSRAHLDVLDRIKEAKATRRLAELYAASTGRPEPVVHTQRGDRVEHVLRCVVGLGVEVLVSIERTGLSRADIQTMLSEITAVVQGRAFGSASNRVQLETASPAGTERLLEVLTRAGMTDAQFAKLHPKPGETITRHLHYVRGRQAFRADSPNARVNERLQVCLHCYTEASTNDESDDSQSIMERCIKEAVRVIPIS